MNEYSLTDQELTELRVLHRELTDQRQADRVKAVILLCSGDGWTPSQVAAILLLDRTTIRRYYRDYKKGGVNRLLETNYLRHRGYLSPEQEHDLDESLKDHPPSYRAINLRVGGRALGDSLSPKRHDRPAPSARLRLHILAQPEHPF